MEEFLLSLYLLGAFSGSPDQSPFWMTANRSGLAPEGSYRTWHLDASTKFDDSKTWQWRWGASLDLTRAGERQRETFGPSNGALTHFWNRDLFVDELYASGRWKALTLDVGMKQVETDFNAPGEELGSMSVTGGHYVESGNARPMPGYLLSLAPVAIPFTSGRVHLYGAFGDFRTIDDRYVDGALVHRTKIFFKFNITRRLDFTIGLDHFAQWGGTSPHYGRMPETFGNYLRVITGSSASSQGSTSDRINVIGNQGGGELLRFDYRGDGFRMTFQHDIPYDDGSGMGFQNFPDGINTLHFGFDDKNRWVSDVLYEYHYTMWQSGTAHDRPATPEEMAKQDPSDYYYGRKIIGGRDNYFNNGEYRSGWTHFAHTIGNPLMYPGPVDSQGTIAIVNNRLKAHHISLAGMAFRKMPYKLMLTYSKNYGTYSVPFPEPLKQFSGALMGETRSLKWVTATYGIYYDRGDVRHNGFGFTAGIKYVIVRSDKH